MILSCLDNRIAVEDVFDLGIGDIFVARVAQAQDPGDGKPLFFHRGVRLAGKVFPPRGRPEGAVVSERDCVSCLRAKRKRYCG